MNQLQIGFLIYPGVIQLDVMGAYQVLSFPPNTQVHLLCLLDAFQTQTQKVAAGLNAENKLES